MICELLESIIVMIAISVSDSIKLRIGEFTDIGQFSNGISL